MRRILLIVLLFMIGNTLKAQDVGLFSQKLTNSFLYNPSVAGHTVGSLTFSHKQNFSGLYNNNFLSFHIPIADHRFGWGVNFFNDQVNFAQNIYLSTAFAYHIKFGRLETLSMGLSGEYNLLDFDFSQINFEEGLEDPFFQDYNKEERADFSFGMLYEQRYFKAGFSVNRLVSLFRGDSSRVLSGFYTLQLSGMIPARQGLDLFEPMLFYRSFGQDNQVLNVEAYYTLNDLLTLGGGWRNGGFLNATVAVKFARKLTFGYTREFYTGEYNLGASNEFVLRFDFKDQNYQKRYDVVTRQSTTYRRKMLSKPVRSSKGKTKIARGPVYRASIKRNSPNRRYNQAYNPKKHQKMMKKRRKQNYRKVVKGRKPKR